MILTRKSFSPVNKYSFFYFVCCVFFQNFAVLLQIAYEVILQISASCMKKIAYVISLFFTYQTFAQTIDFNAKAIVAISDADMAASAFIDGKLLKEKGSKDAFSVIKLPVEKYSDEIKSVVVSNSAIDWTKDLVIAQNGKLAYVVESRGAVAETTTEVKNVMTDLPSGAYITVVDISDLNQPKVLFKFPTGKNPTSIELSANGEYLALCSEEYGKELQILELDAAGKPIRIINKPALMPAGKVSDVAWHPDGNYLAYTLEDSKQVGLIKALKDGPTQKIIRLDVVGQPLQVGEKPGAGKFTQDGKYYLIPDLKADKSDMFVMKFNLTGEGQHFLLSKANINSKPQGFDISPDGSLIVVANANKTFYPWDSKELTKKASLTLMKLPADGMIQTVGEYEFEGILPESIAFDANGENIAVSVFDYFNYGKHFGGIEFWSVKNGDKPSLKKQDIKYFVPRGCHSLKIIK